MTWSDKEKQFKETHKILKAKSKSTNPSSMFLTSKPANEKDRQQERNELSETRKASKFQPQEQQKFKDQPMKEKRPSKP